MRLLVFSIYDSAVKAFNNPLFFRSQGEAMRAFTGACAEEGSMFRKHSADYTLFAVGEFDDATGIVTSLSAPVRVIGAAEVIVDDDVFPASKRIS